VEEFFVDMMMGLSLSDSNHYNNHSKVGHLHF